MIVFILLLLLLASILGILGAVLKLAFTVLLGLFLAAAIAAALIAWWLRSAFGFGERRRT